MKKILISLAAMIAVNGVVFAGGDSTQMKYVSILPNQATTNDGQTITGSAVDVSAYKGNSTFLVLNSAPVGGSTNYLATVEIYHSTTGTSSWTRVNNIGGDNGTLTSSGNTAASQQYYCDLARLHKYVKATAHSTNDVGGFSVTLIAPMKSE